MSLVSPLPCDRLPARAALLVAGLALYGVSMALLLRSGLGTAPWAVLDQGLQRTVGLTVGFWSVLVGALVLAAWAPLRQRPGAGTLANVVLVGVGVDLTMLVVPDGTTPAARAGLLVAGVLLNGVATGAYIGAGLGPGPRDGLTTGLAARGLPLGPVRAALELTVLGAGWLLGGTVGVGTVVYALAIGPLMHVSVPLLRLRPRSSHVAGPRHGTAAAVDAPCGAGDRAGDAAGGGN